MKKLLIAMAFLVVGLSTADAAISYRYNAKGKRVTYRLPKASQTFSTRYLCHGR